MKKIVCGLLLLGWACSALAAGERRDMHQVSGEFGDVRFHGRVFVSPCVLDMASSDQVVELGDIPASVFHRAGDRSRPVLVTLYLKDCLKGSGHLLQDVPGQTSEIPALTHSTAERGVSLTLMAEGDPQNTDLARIQGEVNGAGIRIMDRLHQPVALNQTQRMWVLKPGDNRIYFLAALESTGRDVTAGEFRGLLRLKLEYL